MENLFIESTEYSPKILFDVKNRKFELIGISRPEDVIAFYESVLYKIEKYVKKTIENNNDLKNFTFNLKFDLTYMNSASSKYILQILDHFKQLYLKEANIIIEWLYDDVDDQIFEDGEDLSDVIKIPFNLIPR
jgi:SiaC family regulatory phosphoprotein